MSSPFRSYRPGGRCHPGLNKACGAAAPPPSGCFRLSSDVVTLTVGATPAPREGDPHPLSTTTLPQTRASSSTSLSTPTTSSPTIALNDGDLGRQLLPDRSYLENAGEAVRLQLLRPARGGIHLEPLGVFSNKHKSLDELPGRRHDRHHLRHGQPACARSSPATQASSRSLAGDGDVNINTVTVEELWTREARGPQPLPARHPGTTRSSTAPCSGGWQDQSPR